MEAIEGLYSEAVKADVSQRLNTPHRWSVVEIAQEQGIHVITLHKWRNARRLQSDDPEGKREN